ncbi:hypothetical protein [Micromonospora sp. NPDC005220]|uniref:hypothetical protein n=1 Tax=Micromonospora sp. NPDC005220 TaxID=3155589 RepID=UPI0033AA576B
MDDLAAARAAHNAAVARKDEALANLREAGIQARLAIDELDDTLGNIAKKNGLLPATLTRLNPSRIDGSWSPHGIEIYETIDKITYGRYRLVELRRAFDNAKEEAKRAETTVSLAEARTDGKHAARMASATAQAVDSQLVIDDVLVDRRSDRVVLDVRVRNAGERAVNITRVAVRITERTRFLASYPVTAHYDLRVDGDYNEVDVAHHVKPDDVDRFTLTLGFAEPEIGHVFTAELVVRFNRDHVAVSTSFTFDSCFE